MDQTWRTYKKMTLRRAKTCPGQIITSECIIQTQTKVSHIQDRITNIRLGHLHLVSFLGLIIGIIKMSIITRPNLIQSFLKIPKANTFRIFSKSRKQIGKDKLVFQDLINKSK